MFSPQAIIPKHCGGGYCGTSCPLLENNATREAVVNLEGTMSQSSIFWEE